MDNIENIKKYKKIVKIVNNDKLLPATKFHLIHEIINICQYQQPY
jgi:hypothetical protein